MQKNTPHLSDRNLQTIHAIGQFKYLSSQQIWREFYPTSTQENATQRLTTLHKHGFLSRDFAYPKAVTNPGQRPTAIYFFSAKNKDNLRAYLTAHGKADLYEDFAILPTTDKDDGNTYSNAHLVHEISIAEFFMPLEKAAANNPEWKLLMWEITSPRSADIPERDVRLRVKDRRTKNPDGSSKEYITSR